MALGRAEVDVVADTSKFRDQVRAAVESTRGEVEIPVEPTDLREFRRKVNDATKAMRPAKVPVEPDMSGFRRKVNAATSQMRAARIPIEPLMNGFRAKVNAATREMRPARVPIDPVLTGFRRKVNEATKAMTPARVPINPVLTGFREKVNTATRAMRAVRIPVEPDMRGFRARIVAWARTMAPVAVPIRPRMSTFRTEVRRAFAGLDPMDIPVRFNTSFRDRTGGGRGGIERLLASRTGNLGNVLISGLFGPIGHLIHSWGTVEHALRRVSQAFRQLFVAGSAAARGLSVAVRGIGTGLSTAFTGLRAIGTGVQGLFRGVSGALSTIGEGIGQVFSGIFSTVRNVFGALAEVSQRVHVVIGALFGLVQALFSVISPFIQFIGLLTAGAAGLGALYQPIGGLIQLVDGLGSGMAAVPAALAIATAGLITFKFALGGVGDALSAALTANDKLFEQIVTGLAPLQQKFARMLRGAFRPLQELASTAFLTPLMRAMESLSGTGLGATFRNGLQGASDAMGQLAANTVKFFGTASGIRLVQQSFGALEAIFDGLARGMNDLMTGISDAVNALLGTKGAMQGIEGTVASLTSRFGRWLSEQARIGAVQNGWTNFKNTLRDVWDISMALIGVIDEIGDAMVRASGAGREGASGGPLGAITDMLKGFREALSDPGTQAAMEDFFRGLDDIGRGVWKFARDATAAFGFFIQGLIAPEDIKQATGPLTGLREEAKKTADALRAQADAIMGRKSTSLGDAFRRLGDVIARNRTGIVNFGKDVAGFFRELVRNHGLERFIENLGKVTKSIAELSTALAGLFGDKGPKALGGGKETVPFLIDQLSKLFGVTPLGEGGNKKVPGQDFEEGSIRDFWNRFKNLFGGPEDSAQFREGGRAAATALMQGFGDAVKEQGKTAFVAFKTAITENFGNAPMEIAQAIFGGGKGAGGGEGGGVFSTAFTDMISTGVKDAWTKFSDFVKELFGGGKAEQQVAEAFFDDTTGTSFGGEGGPVSTSLASMVKAGATNAWEKIKGFFKEVFGKTPGEIAKAIFSNDGGEGGGGSAVISTSLETVTGKGTDDAWASIKNKLVQVFSDTTTEIATGVSKGSSGDIETPIQRLANAGVDAAWEAMKAKIWDAFIGTAAAIANAISSGASGLISAAINSLIPNISVSDIIGKALPNGGRADGGMVYGPEVSLIGEAGPELVIPLMRPRRAAELVRQSGLLDIIASVQGPGQAPMASGGGGGGPVSVHVHTPATNPEVLIRQMQRALVQALG